MSTLVGIFVAFAFFEWPWRAAVLGAFLLFDAFEIWIWLRWRKKKSITGADQMVGEAGEALTDLHPDGQVKMRGQIWHAHASDGAAAGDTVVVTGIDGIKLEVARR